MKSLVCVCPCPFLQGSADEEPEEMPPPDAETVQVIPGSELIWRIAPRPDNSAQVSTQHSGEEEKQAGGRLTMTFGPAGCSNFCLLYAP